MEDRRDEPCPRSTFIDTPPRAPSDLIWGTILPLNSYFLLAFRATFSLPCPLSWTEGRRFWPLATVHTTVCLPCCSHIQVQSWPPKSISHPGCPWKAMRSSTRESWEIYRTFTPTNPQLSPSVKRGIILVERSLENFKFQGPIFTDGEIEA